jgi:DNA repair protein RadC
VSTSSPPPHSTTHRIQDIPPQDRPRERLLRIGPEALTDAELLALFINVGIPGENAIQVAQRLLRSHACLQHLAKLEPAQLCTEKGVGPAKAALLSAAFELGRRAEKERLIEIPLTSPEHIFELVAPSMQHLPHEMVRVLLVNSRLGFIRQEQISHGSVNESMAHPRDVLRPVIMHAAYGFVMVHNHPSGDPSPSDADLRVTRRVRDAASTLGLQFLDHVIIGQYSESRSTPYYSFREAGLI